MSSISSSLPQTAFLTSSQTVANADNISASAHSSPLNSCTSTKTAIRVNDSSLSILCKPTPIRPPIQLKSQEGTFKPVQNEKKRPRASSKLAVNKKLKTENAQLKQAITKNVKLLISSKDKVSKLSKQLSAMESINSDLRKNLKLESAARRHCEKLLMTTQSFNNPFAQRIHGLERQSIHGQLHVLPFPVAALRHIVPIPPHASAAPTARGQEKTGN